MNIPLSVFAVKVRKPKPVLLVAGAGLLVVGLVCNLTLHASAAGCPPQATDYGTVTGTVTLPAAATYRVWSHVYVPDTANNTYLLDVGGNCFNVGGANVPTGSWQWVANHDGDATLKNDVTLQSGAQTIKLIGNKPNVKVDRVIFAADLACTPTGDGSNCNTPADITAPVVQLTAPVADSTVSGTVTMTATATDNVAVTRAEFYVNGALVGTDATAPYSASWSTVGTPNGAQAVGVKAYDAAGNAGQANFQVTVQNGDTQAPSVPAGLKAAAAAYNNVNLSWTASTDNVGVKGYTLLRDGVPIADVITGTTYADTGVAANTAYGYQVLAYDTAGNKSAASTKVSVTTPTVPDTQAPSVPADPIATAVSANQINLSWTASTDNTGVVAYDVYRATGSGTPAKVASVQGTTLADANLTASTTYSYYVKARDGGGNQSAASSAVTATTMATPSRKHKHGKVTGAITNTATGAAVSYATVTLDSGTTQQTYVANKRGQYKIGSLDPGVYRLTYRAQNYKTVAETIQVPKADSHVTKNVKLQKQRGN